MMAKSDEPVGQATLDIFSGRPNPTWTLTPEATAELRQRLATLSARLSAAPPSARPRLSANYADAGRQLERWLLNTAQGKIAPDVLGIAAHSLR